MVTALNWTSMNVNIDVKKVTVAQTARNLLPDWFKSWFKPLLAET